MTQKQRMAELDLQLERQAEALKDLREQHGEALETADRMRDQLEDMVSLIDSWTEAFHMEQREDGLWYFDHNELWDAHETLYQEHRKLIGQWNKFVGEYNRTVAPRRIGRPLEASEAQIKEVRKFRKAKASLRTIAEKTGLGLRTVRTILTSDTGKQANLLRRREFNRLAAAEYRARKKTREQIPKRIDHATKNAAKLIKAAKGLGQG